MKSITITVYALKSTRKNAKANCKSYYAYPDSEKLKKSFTNSDYADLQEWCLYQIEKYGYKYFQFTVSDGTDTLSNGDPIFIFTHEFRDGKPYENEYCFCTSVKRFMDLYNAYTKNPLMSL